MKKITKSTLAMFGLIAFMSCIIASCGNSVHSSGITVVGSDSTVFESYEDACHAQDYEAAHKYLVAMKKAGSSNYKEAREYVFSQEALYLISQNDEVSTKRLFFLLEEDANEVDQSTHDSRCNQIIELAIKQNNQVLVEQTIGQYHAQIGLFMMRKIYDYLYSSGRITNTDYIIDLLSKNDGIGIMVEDAINRQDDAIIMKILERCSNLKEDLLKNIAYYYTEKKDKKQLLSFIKYLRAKQQWSILMEVAIATNDVALMKEVYQKVDDKTVIFEKMAQHAVDNKSSKEMRNLIPLVTNSLTARVLIEKSIEADIPDAVPSLTKKYGTMYSGAFLNQIMDYAVSKNGNEFTNLVISILNSTPIKGHPLPAGQRMTDDRPQSVVDDHNDYVQSVKAFNRKCDYVLSSAIAQHKGMLAKKVITLYKEVPIDYVVNEHWWQFAKTCTYSNDDKKRAQERLNEAKRRGDI